MTTSVGFMFKVLSVNGVIPLISTTPNPAGYSMPSGTPKLGTVRQSPTSKPQVTGRRNEDEVLKLRIQGLSFSEIATKLGFSGGSTARAALNRALAKLAESTQENAKEVLSMELLRLDRILQGCLPKAEAGDNAAIASVLRIQDRRARYLGLDAPTKTDVSIREIDRLIESELIRLALNAPSVD